MCLLILLSRLHTTSVKTSLPELGDANISAVSREPIFCKMLLVSFYFLSLHSKVLPQECPKELKNMFVTKCSCSHRILPGFSQQWKHAVVGQLRRCYVCQNAKESFSHYNIIFSNLWGEGGVGEGKKNRKCFKIGTSRFCYICTLRKNHNLLHWTLHTDLFQAYLPNVYLFLLAL